MQGWCARCLTSSEMSAEVNASWPLRCIRTRTKTHTNTHKHPHTRTRRHKHTRTHSHVINGCRMFSPQSRVGSGRRHFLCNCGTEGRRDGGMEERERAWEKRAHATFFLSLSLPAWSDPVLAGREERDLMDPSVHIYMHILCRCARATCIVYYSP
jgi:hypothetical protein